MSREVAEAIASYFEAIGIRTKLVGEEFVSFEKRQRASKGPEVEYVNLGTKGRAGAQTPVTSWTFSSAQTEGSAFTKTLNLTKNNTEVKKHRGWGQTGWIDKESGETDTRRSTDDSNL